MTLELRPNEYVKIEAHFSFKVFVIPTLLMSIGIIMFLAVWSGVGEGEHINLIGHVYSVAGIMMFIGGLLFIPYIYKRVDNRLKIYAVTNQRVYVRRGIINIKEKDIPLAKINDVQIVQSLIQRLFGAGDAIVQVGNDESSMVIHDIAHPREFRDIIISAIYEVVAEQEAQARQRRFYEQQQRRLEQQQNEYNEYGDYPPPPPPADSFGGY